MYRFFEDLFDTQNNMVGVCVVRIVDIFTRMLKYIDSNDEF